LLAGGENTTSDLRDSRATTDTGDIEKATGAKRICAKAFLLTTVSCCPCEALRYAYGALRDRANEVTLGEGTGAEGCDSCKDGDTHFAFS
jgi:hypothetical protein